jgi:hypothetical protein
MKRKAKKPVSEGGNGVLWIGAAVVVGCVLLMIPKGDSEPVGPDNNPGGPDLLAVFLSNPNKAEAKADARLFGEIAGSVSEVLSFDGTLGDKSRIRTGHSLAVFRNDARYLAARGQSFGVKYPAIKDVIEKFLDEKAGRDGDELSSDSRKAWVAAFKSISDSALWASRKL